METSPQEKTCTKCKESYHIDNFYTKKKTRKDGTVSRHSWCVLCKIEYNNEYMRKRREDPAFREKERKYLEEWTNRRYQPH